MDCEEHAQLLALEAEAAADVQKYAGCSLADKAAVQKLSLTFQDKCARMRALTRDLELLAEELDRWGRDERAAGARGPPSRRRRSSPPPLSSLPAAPLSLRFKRAPAPASLPSEDEERQQAAQVLAGHKAEYERLQGAFKAAALAQRTAALRSAAEERKELLSGADAGLRQRKAQTEADAVALAEDVTGGLRRTRQVRRRGGGCGRLGGSRTRIQPGRLCKPQNCADLLCLSGACRGAGAHQCHAGGHGAEPGGKLRR